MKQKAISKESKQAIRELKKALSYLDRVRKIAMDLHNKSLVNGKLCDSQKTGGKNVS